MKGRLGSLKALSRDDCDRGFSTQQSIRVVQSCSNVEIVPLVLPTVCGPDATRGNSSPMGSRLEAGGTFMASSAEDKLMPSRVQLEEIGAPMIDSCSIALALQSLDKITGVPKSERHGRGTLRAEDMRSGLLVEGQDDA
ncbi:hypothetical protein CJ030_MR8G026869 [Morella rubra]|uniref:Uncharacterized protein n=1 Tax=Morella rubra TaxID=262757 RepID=A0A6A1ULL6_9ROSI|nr:hypothetical protein CJ030_MR0G006574 [Morella rubra]KAB1203275.1 hypothetical protein CJ030_MR8G026869 [Morella rubra]